MLIPRGSGTVLIPKGGGSVLIPRGVQYDIVYWSIFINFLGGKKGLSNFY